MTDYKSYSLEQLENWIHDAICAGEASPHEIYSTIRKSVQEEYNIHRNLADRCFGLLELLSGHRPVNLSDDWKIDDVLKEKEYYEPSMPPWGHSDLEYMVHNTVNKWVLPVEIDAASGEYYLQLPDDLLNSLGWKEGDTLEYSDNKDGSFRVKKVSSQLNCDEY